MQGDVKSLRLIRKKGGEKISRCGPNFLIMNKLGKKLF